MLLHVTATVHAGCGTLAFHEPVTTGQINCPPQFGAGLDTWANGLDTKICTA